MTPAEYIKQKTDRNVVEFVRFEGSTSHAWSEWTISEFSCTLTYVYDDPEGYQTGYYYLDENEVIEFLTAMFEK